MAFRLVLFILQIMIIAYMLVMVQDKVGPEQQQDTNFFNNDDDDSGEHDEYHYPCGKLFMPLYESLMEISIRLMLITRFATYFVSDVSLTISMIINLPTFPFSMREYQNS